MEAKQVIELLCTPGVRVLIMDLDTALMQQVLDAAHNTNCPLRIVIGVKTLCGEQIMTFKKEA
jgi:hypothetical protein